MQFPLFQLPGEQFGQPRGLLKGLKVECHGDVCPSLFDLNNFIARPLCSQREARRVVPIAPPLSQGGGQSGSGALPREPARAAWRPTSI
jgi:hypothetical protein